MGRSRKAVSALGGSEVRILPLPPIFRIIFMSQFKLGLSFDDVLLIPRRSSISSRRDVILETMFSRHIKLSLPLVSSNMDTVTESKMARVMAELGGLGIIHRFIPIEK